MSRPARASAPARTSSSTGYFSDWRRLGVAAAKDLQGAIDLAARILEEMGVREPPVPDSFISSLGADGGGGG